MYNKINPFKIRSLLFVPANKKEFINKILTLEETNKPDGVILDLEDSVSPDYKNKARSILSGLFHNQVLINKLRHKYIICIRINEYDSKWFKEDLNLVNATKPDFLMLPKISSLTEMKNIKNQSLAQQFIITIETLLGLENLSKITSIMSFYDLLAIGYEDISSELLIERPNTLKNISPLAFILMYLLIKARRKNLIVIDAPSRKFIDKKALKDLEEECVVNKENGFSCKMVIHPNQISIINNIFEKKSLINKAKNIINKFKQLPYGVSVTKNEQNEMIDTPSYKMYKKILHYWDK
ncbi:MAG: hypothetical protein ACD_20C00154G0001 [uncultured bacterium]|nr:MAG: hypothetical protein ACD_20C00154G0001 [uncultured bacterium]